MALKRRFFTNFFTKQIIFLGSRRNISTNEPVLERLLNFWNFGTYFKLMTHPVKVWDPPKVKKLKIGVARKLDLIEPNWVYSFSSFIEPYQTRIVRPILFLDYWTVFWIKFSSLSRPWNFKLFRNGQNIEILSFTANFENISFKFSKFHAYFVQIS